MICLILERRGEDDWVELEVNKVKDRQPGMGLARRGCYCVVEQET
jgi:hypothetical protein